jgi:hypothetical protein
MKPISAALASNSSGLEITSAPSASVAMSLTPSIS